jgi:hypothetical protein
MGGLRRSFGLPAVGDDYALGIRAEGLAARVVAKTEYTEIVFLQNNSRHGIDFVARNKAGQLRFFEVKGHWGVAKPLLQGEQRSITRFVTTRLARISSGKGHWVRVDPKLVGAAKAIQAELRGGASIKGMIINVDNAGGFFPKVTVSRWR